MWRGRLGGCCFVGLIPFEFSTGETWFFACGRSQYKIRCGDI